MLTEFRVCKSEKGYRVEMYRGGQPYVTFADGLAQDAAEREAERFRVLWSRIQGRPDQTGHRAATDPS